MWPEIDTRIRNEYLKTSIRAHKYSFPTSIIREWRVYSPLVKHSAPPLLQDLLFQNREVDHRLDYHRSSSGRTAWTKYYKTTPAPSSKLTSPQPAAATARCRSNSIRSSAKSKVSFDVKINYGRSDESVLDALQQYLAAPHYHPKMTRLGFGQSRKPLLLQRRIARTYH